MHADDPDRNASIAERAALIADVERSAFGVTDEASRAEQIRRFLSGVPWALTLIPTTFWLRFGEVGPVGWGVTVFVSLYCALAALGLYLAPRTELHTTVELRGGWGDRLGGFWLVACAFGPFAGWIAGEVLPLTSGSWRWTLGTKVLFAAVLPIATAVPLFRYARGRAALVVIPLLLVVTLLPVLTARNAALDLIDGARPMNEGAGKGVYELRHSGRTFEE
jgi:hypothetical protein